MVKPGSIVSGVVERVTPHAIIVDVNAKGLIKGTILPEHLADNHGIQIFSCQGLVHVCFLSLVTVFLGSGSFNHSRVE